MHRRLLAALAIALSIASSGCGGAPAAVEAPPSPPPARNAGEIAWDIVHAHTSALTYVDRVRGRPIAAKIQSLELFRPYLEGTGLRPEQDLDRAFVAAPGTDRADETIVVAQHHLPPEQIRAALGLMIATGRIEGAWIEGAPVPEARVTARGQTRVLALIEPNFLVLLPEAHALEATRFVGTGGFPDPTGPEAVVAGAERPAETVRGPHIPPIPPSIASLHAVVTLGDDGGAAIAVDGPSASPEQAVADAAELTRAVDAATSVKVAFFRVRVFRPIPFFADGDHVKADVRLTAAEIDTLFGALSAFVPR